MSLIDLNPGQNGIIEDILCDVKLSKRLQALGCIEGTEVFIKNKAPFGDPIIINIRGFDLAIRKKDARHISLKEIAYDNCSISR
jgi:ferrous iron transport protein A